MIVEEEPDGSKIWEQLWLEYARKRTWKPGSRES
jgi:hypothetical protein